ncbi:hypothetical protein GCM10022251_81970 [Phytohabitans flavus]|uniref:YcaO domain-containing protein n=1 Tax=Phytohabitans flavus TaxID=1076124 RepID=A0A6F8XV37_9ACTN|nr:YcaO-like family protein [Phytohabitans flavus]BCB77722.1 hypothetical protein Pflav_041320 [Phytohabitans flavus]
MLPADVLVVARADTFIVHRAHATVRVDLDRGADPRTIADAVRCGPAALAERGLVSATEAAELELALAEQGIHTDLGRPAELPFGVAPLAAVVTAFAESRALSEGVLAVTATEALWLPPDAKPATRERALRLFVSRLPDQVRLGTYGWLAAGHPGLSSAGDLPDTEWAQAVRAAVTGTAEVTTWSWATGELELTGRFVEGIPAGRLSVTQVAGLDEWPLDDGTVIHYARGSYASPHLSTLDPFAPVVAANHCAGADVDPAQARTKCVAEGLERFALGDIPERALYRAPAERLPDPWLDPSTVISYDAAHRERLGLDVFDPARLEWWTAGQRPDGTPIWLPAALVFMQFPDLPPWLHHGYLSTNAAAAHPDPEQAVLRAWLEAVERDAFQRARAAERATTAIALPSLPASLGPLVRYVRARVDLRLAVLPAVAGIPVVAAAGVGDNGLVLGMSAAATPEAAARKALLEACAELRYPFTDDPDPESVRTPFEHGALYRKPARLSRLAWLLDGPIVDWRHVKTPGPPRIPDRAAIYRFPSRLLDGLTVAKVLDPDLVPITFGYDSDPTGHPAFAEGYRRRGVAFTEPLFPHPFA